MPNLQNKHMVFRGRSYTLPSTADWRAILDQKISHREDRRGLI